MTAEQWEVIQSHTKLAAAIVGRIPSLTPAYQPYFITTSDEMAMATLQDSEVRLSL